MLTSMRISKYDCERRVDIWLITRSIINHGRQEGGHHAAGQRSAQRDLHLDDILARYELVTEADVFKEILKELRGSRVLNGLRSKGNFRLGHVVVESTDLRRQER